MRWSQLKTRIEERICDRLQGRVQVRHTLLYGRRMYQLMASYWPTAETNPSAPDSHK